jgi:tRNA dimethylallyltransferase
VGRRDLIPLVAVVGPTAVGKTGLATAVGPQFGAEAISADSRQFYHMMDIGTAKPTPEELARLPHHLVDFADPDETVGLARFLNLARAAVEEIHRRSKVPFLVGGTGQYVRALLQGWQVPEVPPDPELRAELEAQGERDPEGLWTRLMALDPDAAEFIHPNNIRRVVRALEVSVKTGRPFSELRRRVPPPYDVLRIGLTMDRDALYARADARVDAMMEAGLPEEVQRLLGAGYGWELPAMSALGYIQFRPYFEGEATLKEVAERIKLDTHDFIRRQYTWFRLNDPQVHWLDVLENPAPEAESLVREHLALAH